MEYLNDDQKRKEIIELEYNDKLKEIIGGTTVSLYSKGKTKKLFLAGLGQVETYEQKIDLIYMNRLGRLVVKPKLIQDFINSKE